MFHTYRSSWWSCLCQALKTSAFVWVGAIEKPTKHCQVDYYFLYYLILPPYSDPNYIGASFFLNLQKVYSYYCHNVIKIHANILNKETTKVCVQFCLRQFKKKCKTLEFFSLKIFVQFENHGKTKYFQSIGPLGRCFL